MFLYKLVGMTILLGKQRISADKERIHRSKLVVKVRNFFAELLSI